MKAAKTNKVAPGQAEIKSLYFLSMLFLPFTVKPNIENLIILKNSPQNDTQWKINAGHL
jgi:hypothetical protein